MLRFSLGSMVAQQVALDRPSLVRKMLLVATARGGGEDIMHMEKPALKRITDDPNLPGLQKLIKTPFCFNRVKPGGGEAFVARLAARKEDREPISGPKVARSQIMAFRAWEHFSGERFGKLTKIIQPCLVVKGVFDNMIPVRNSYMLSERLPERHVADLPGLRTRFAVSGFTIHSCARPRYFWTWTGSASASKRCHRLTAMM